MNYEASEFDRSLYTEGLHNVREMVEFRPRATVLPPDLFLQYEGLSFWNNQCQSLANVIVAQPQQAAS